MDKFEAYMKILQGFVGAIMFGSIGVLLLANAENLGVIIILLAVAMAVTSIVGIIKTKEDNTDGT